MIIRNNRETNFTILNNDLLNDKELSLKAKGLLCYLLSKPYKWKVHVSHLATECKESKNTLYSIINECIRLGYITRTIHRDIKGKITRTEYDVYDSKQVIKETEVGLMPCPSPDRLIKACEINMDIPANRKDLFYAQVKAYQEKSSGKYPRALYNEFFNYWTEIENGIVKKKKEPVMRFEKEKFFDIARRLATFWNNKSTSQKKNYQV